MTSGPFTRDVESHTLLTDPLRNFRFLVDFNPLGTNPLQFSASMGFVSVSGLNVTTESIAYREGGYNTTVHQIPGMTTFSPVTMNRGVLLGSSQNVQWMRRLFSVVTGSAGAGVGADFRCNVDISVLGHPNPKGTANSESTSTVANPSDLFVAMRFRLYNAWITNLAYSDLNAGDNNLLVESITLVHEGWDVRFSGNDYKTSAAEFDTPSAITGGGGGGAGTNSVA